MRTTRVFEELGISTIMFFVAVVPIGKSLKA